MSSHVFPPPPPPSGPSGPSGPAGAPAATLDVRGTSPVPFWRLCLVELRKARDTRAGFWLMFTIGLLVTLLQLIALISVNVQDIESSFTDFTGNVFLVALILMPILAIMLVTTEWSQRTAMVSFTLEPRRLRVVLAKLGAAVLLALLTVALMFVVAAVCTALCDVLQPELTDWDVEAEFVFLLAPIALVVTTVFGFALASLFLNTPASIVVFLIAWYASLAILAAIAGFIPAFEDVIPWLSIQLNVLLLAEELPQTAEAWGQLLVSGGVWIVAPLVLGVLRILRAEVK
ncbi:MAG TPA: ABC transporter permease [Nocardioides sp.]|nr:ABC transporter permease [Nocardioides sp.]